MTLNQEMKMMTWRPRLWDLIADRSKRGTAIWATWTGRCFAGQPAYQTWRTCDVREIYVTCNTTCHRNAAVWHLARHRPVSSGGALIRGSAELRKDRQKDIVLTRFKRKNQCCCKDSRPKADLVRFSTRGYCSLASLWDRWNSVRFFLIQESLPISMSYHIHIISYIEIIISSLSDRSQVIYFHLSSQGWTPLNAKLEWQDIDRCCKKPCSQSCVQSISWVAGLMTRFIHQGSSLHSSWSQGFIANRVKVPVPRPNLTPLSHRRHQRTRSLHPWNFGSPVFEDPQSFLQTWILAPEKLRPFGGPPSMFGELYGGSFHNLHSFFPAKLQVNFCASCFFFSLFPNVWLAHRSARL